MIQIPGPSVSLNDVRVGGPVHLDRSLKIYKDDSRQNIVAAVANLATAAPGGRLKSIVLNSHGAPGYLILGEGFWGSHASLFQPWQGLIGTIWITACQIASRKPVTGKLRMHGQTLSGQCGDGFLFCQQIAINAKCNVVASLNTQYTPSQENPTGSVDSFEGRLLCWKADGNVAWTRMYSMTSAD